MELKLELLELYLEILLNFFNKFDEIESNEKKNLENATIADKLLDFNALLLIVLNLICLLIHLFKEKCTRYWLTYVSINAHHKLL